MGTKNNPGAFDCYTNAKPDEPMFVLLARDRHAASLVRFWALLRHQSGEDDAKVAEALACAQAMRLWRNANHKREMDDQERRRIEAMLMALTTGMADHPDDYDDSCDCDTCRSYD